MRRPLIISGFMASGKTTAARRVAERTGHPFVDLDAEVELAAGTTIPEVFRREGEPGFRRLEARALHAALEREDAPVISVGAGALLRRSDRLAAARRGVVVTLTARLETVRERMGSGSGRPLAQGADGEWLARLLELRAPVYAEAHERLAVDALTPDEVAERLLAIWQRDPIGVLAGAASYGVEVGRGLSHRLGPLVSGATLGLLVTDVNVDALYGAGAERSLATAVRASRLVLPAGEAHKTPGTLEQIWNHALAVGADRSAKFVGMGGGVVTDITGFAAATWMRGVPWLSVSTNLQGMVDASVGGKTAVDLAEAKNCVGAFWQPSWVLCDVEHLKSEPERSYRGALAEVMKTALIGDPALVTLLESERQAVLARDLDVLEEVVRRCIAVKAEIVSEDEREGGRRAALNLGHTLGHALEAYGGYGHLTHGEAVSLGLVAALGLGAHLGFGSRELHERVTAWLAACGLPSDVHAHPLRQAAALVGHDKKRKGSAVRFVFCREAGQIQFEPLQLDQLPSLLDEWLGATARRKAP